MNNPTVTAFCPGHISGYFRRIEGNTPADTGSIGAGIVIGEGVTAMVRQSETLEVTIIRENNDGTVRDIIRGSPLITSVMQKISVTATIITRCRLPIGAGFGLSAAALLASLTAVNRLLALGYSPKETAAYAHEAEIMYRTGLGDVAACQGGGIAIRTSPGIDGEIERWPGNGETFWALSRGSIPTPSVLSSPVQMKRVGAAYPGRAPSDIRDFFSLCREFDERSGLLTPEVASALRACDRASVPAAMTMLGNGVFARGDGAREVLSAFGEVFELRVAERGPVIIGESA